MTEPRGIRLLQSSTLEAALEHDVGHSLTSIEKQDQLLAHILERCLSAERVITLEPADKPGSIRLASLPSDLRGVLQER